MIVLVSCQLHRVVQRRRPYAGSMTPEKSESEFCVRSRENKTKIASRIGIDRTSNLDPLIFSNPAQATIKIYPLRSMYCYYTINSTVLSSALSVFRFP